MVTSPNDVTIQALTQARQPLIERTFESLAGVPQAIVHLYNSTAPIMRRVVLGLDEDGVVDLAVVHTTMIREMADARPQTRWTLEYSPEMFSGTELAFSKRVVDAVTEAWGATTERKVIVNLPSTVEHSTANIFADMIEWMHRHLERREAIVLSVHPHNDRGTGTAAGEFAVMAGADRVEGCLFGNGERTGNVDLVNLALNLYTQGVHPHLDLSQIDEIRRVVEHCNQLPVHPRHPYVGDLVYTSFSGSHQDAIKKAFAARRDGDIWDMPYLPIDPLDLGRSYEAVIRVNSQSGKGGIAYLLETIYHLELPRRLQIEFSRVVQAVMDDAGKELTAAELWNIFEREYVVGADSWRIEHANITDRRSDDGRDSVAVKADVVGREGRITIEGTGNGPLDAFVNGFNATTGLRVEVLDYHEHAVGGGAQARAAAYLEVRVGDQTALFGVGIDANIVHASMKAVLSGVARSRAGSEPDAREGVWLLGKRELIAA